MEQPRNKDQKCPVILVLDTSGSMSGNPINELNKSLIKLKEDLLSDPILSQRLELGIVCFDDTARVERPIDLISTDTTIPVLNAGGTTNLVSGINMAIDIIEERKKFYKSNGEQYYRPFIVLFTDGSPTNSEQEINELDESLQKLSDNKKFVFIPFGVEGADMALLAKIAVQSSDERLKNQARAWKLTDISKFSEMFTFVSSSISSAMSQGTTQTATMPTDVAQSVTFDLGT